MVEQLQTLMSNMTTHPDCDPTVEDCSAFHPLDWPEHPPNDLYTYAAICFANAVLPALYYNISADY